MEAPEKIYCESDGLGNIVRAHNMKWPDDEAENIEYTRTDAFIEKACRCYCDDICDQRLFGMCFYKHDGQGQIKNTFKYNECNELKLLINGIKERIIMAHLIDKDALVAEIDRILGSLTNAAFDSMIGKNLIEIKDFIDTLEVKEVDLESEMANILKLWKC